MPDTPLTLHQAAVQILRERGPMNARDLARAILDQGRARSGSKHPENTLSSIITVDIKNRGPDSEFVRVGRGVYGLRVLHAGAPPPRAQDVPANPTAPQPDAPEPIDRPWVRIPLFPRYRELRQLLKIWPGHQKKQVTGLRASLSKIWGTPQKSLDWTNPSAWIPARLSGEDRALALAIWKSSRQTVNPRYTYGAWLLAQSYHLIAPDPADVLQLTDRGQRFLAGGEFEAQIDASEGLLKILALVADNGPTRTAEIMAGWAHHLRRFSAIKSNATQKNALRDRLNNLADRGLVHKDGRVYAITDAGRAHLHQARETPEPRLKDIKDRIRQQDTAARAQLKAKLLDINPYAFEHLVKRLLEAMGYESVKTTASSGDGGVDVIGEIEVGITSVKEVVQAKRQRRTIQRKDLDALRGSLHRFGAVRGTLISTSKFSSGTHASATEPGGSPITLIDGDKLIELLVEHGIASQKIPLEVLTVDLQQIDDLENEL